MVQTLMLGAQGAIRPRTVKVSQTNHRAVVQMPTSKTETGLTWISVLSLETRLQQQFGPAMLSMLPAQVSAAVQVQILAQGELVVSVLMMTMLKHCSAGWRKVSRRRRRPLRTLMVVVVLPADQL